VKILYLKIYGTLLNSRTSVWVLFFGETRSYTDSPLILYNTECKSGGVQKLSGAVFCTPPAAEKLTVLYQIPKNPLLRGAGGVFHSIFSMENRYYNHPGQTEFFRKKAGANLPLLFFPEKNIFRPQAKQNY